MAPTPGRITASAAITSAALVVSDESMPTWPQARLTLCRLPMPRSTIATRGSDSRIEHQRARSQSSFGKETFEVSQTSRLHFCESGLLQMLEIDVGCKVPGIHLIVGDKLVVKHRSERRRRCTGVDRVDDV